MNLLTWLEKRWCKQLLNMDENLNSLEKDIKIPFLFPRSKITLLNIFVQATSLSWEYFTDCFSPFLFSTCSYLLYWFNFFLNKLLLWAFNIIIIQWFQYFVSMYYYYYLTLNWHWLQRSQTVLITEILYLKLRKTSDQTFQWLALVNSLVSPNQDKNEPARGGK